jgi:hypothetical protein
MMDDYLSSRGHLLNFHHTLFSHQDDHASLVLSRRPWETSRLLHFCQASVMWKSSQGCENRLFRPCQSLHGLPQIPELDAHSSPESPCAGLDLVKRNWKFILADKGVSCTQVCEKLLNYACDVSGLDVLNTPATLANLYSCPSLPTDSHKVTAPHVEDGHCYVRATRCLAGSTAGFCEEQDPVTSRFCPCSTLV